MNKKLYLSLAVILALFITGCGKQTKKTCTAKQEFGEAELYTEMKLTFEKKYLKKTETTMSIEFTNESTADSFAKTYTDKKDENGEDIYQVEKEGNKVVVKSSSNSTDDKVEENEMDYVIDYLQNRGFTCE